MNLIAAQTAAAVADLPCSASHNQLPVTVVASGLALAETIALEFSVDAGATFIPAVDDTGAAITFTATAYMHSIISPGLYRLNKPSTVGAASVDVFQASYL